MQLAAVAAGPDCFGQKTIASALDRLETHWATVGAQRTLSVLRYSVVMITLG